MRKNVLRILLPLAMLLTLCATAWATGPQIDTDYYGPLDIFTGEPTQATGSLGQALPTDREWVTNTIQYDRNERMYIFPVGDSAYTVVRASVMDGMVSNRAVRIVPDAGVQLSLFRNGEKMEDPDLDNVNLVGEYVVYSGTGLQSDDEILRFTVIGEYTNALMNYSMPDSFQLTEVTCNGEDMYFTRNSVDLSREGAYVIEYRCVRTDVEYTLQYTADFTPPVLALAAVENGIAAGPVDLSDLERGANISIWHNGEAMNPTTTLKASGEYDIIVSDAAGNTNNYAFAIRVYFDGNSIVFFLLVLAVLAATAIYVLMSRKNLRVR